MFKRVTNVPKSTRMTVVDRLFAYGPMIFLLEVRYTWVKTVIGSCTLRNICERINPWNGSPIKKMMPSAGTNESKTPKRECGSA